MKLKLQNLKKLTLSIGAMGLAGAINAQCLTIACPGNMTVTAPTGSCSAVANYSAPIVSNTCGIVSNTISYTGSMQTFTVPAGVTTMTIEAYGAEGGTSTGEGGGGNYLGGRGAYIKGVYTTIPGQVLNLLVGGKGTNSNCGSGGGGGTWVVRAGTLLEVAGGGGGGFHCNYYGGVAGGNGLTTTSGGAGIQAPNNNPQPGYAGGSGGNGGNAYFGGGGGGTLTPGAAGASPANAGGVYPGNGGTPGGGYGGGGGYYVSCCGGSGGGGGYSGGSGGNLDGCAGGGGGSFNSGTGQTNTAGVQLGNGKVILTYGGGTYTTTQVAGLPSGTIFPIGTTVQTFSVVNNFSNTATCSFSVLVADAQTPTITCPTSVTQCAVAVPSIAPASVLDNCPSPSVTYTLTGATTGTGITNASGTFSVGVTGVTYKAMDASGNNATCAFSVTINAAPSMSVAGGGTICPGGQTATLTASGANTYSWSNGSTVAVIAVTPTATTIYTATGTSSVTGCSSAITVTVVVDPCTGIKNSTATSGDIKLYPNPNNGEFTLEVKNNSNKIIEVCDYTGKVVYTTTTSKELIPINLSGLANGIYNVKIQNNNTTETIRVVKQ